MRRLRFHDETGSEVVEFGLVLLPLLAFVFLIMDVAWMCFAQASLQHAVQVGVRAAITSYLPTGATGQDSYIKSIVQSNAMGFLAGQDGLDKITITYYNPTNLSTALSGLGSNAGGNVIQVSVANVNVSALGPILRTGMATLSLHASCTDVMESSPNGLAPSR
jgi:Flp pilus assembly protein TadG